MLDDFAKIKVANLGAILKDKNLSKIVKEGMAAPAGSTKRTKARNVLRTFDKVARNKLGYYGQGGQGFTTMSGISQPLMGTTTMPGLPYSMEGLTGLSPYTPTPPTKTRGGTTPQPSTPTATPSLLPTTPAQNLTISIGADGKISISSPTSSVPPSAIAGQINSVLKGIEGTVYAPGEKPSYTPTGATVKPVPTKGRVTAESQVAQQPILTPEQQKIYSGLQAKVTPTIPTAPVVKPTTTFEKTIEEGKKKLESGQVWGDVWNTIKNQFPEKTNEEIDTGLGIAWKEPGAYEKFKAGQLTEESVLNTMQGLMDAEGVTDTSATDYITEKYNSLTPELQKQYKPVYDAIKKGIDKEQFIYQAQEDKTKLAEMGIPEEAFPGGASLTKTADILAKNLKLEKRLDEQLTNIENMKKTGANIDETMANYVRGRDTYIEELDRLIDKTKDDLYTKDYDPSTQKMMENYLSYLTTLKGRQHNRYVGYINESIKQYQTDVQNATDNYNKSVDQYNEEMTTKTSIAQEDYNRWTGLIGSMYDAMANAEKVSNDAFKSYVDSVHQSAQLVEDLKKINGVQGGDFLANKKDYQTIYEQAVLPVVYGERVGDQTTMFTGNIGVAVDESIKNGLQGDGIFKLLNSEIGTNGAIIFEQSSDPALVQKYLKNYPAVIMNYFNQYGLNTDGSYNSDVVTTAGQLAETFLSHTNYNLKQYLNKNPGTITQIKELITAITKTGGWLGGKIRSREDIEKNRNKIVEEYSSTEGEDNTIAVDPTIINSLIDYLKTVPDIPNPYDALTSYTKYDSDGNATGYATKKLEDMTTDEIVSKIMDGMSLSFLGVTMPYTLQQTPK